MSQRYEGAVRALSKVMAELTAARAENSRLKRIARAAKRIALSAEDSVDAKEWAQFHKAVRAYFFPRTTNRTTKGTRK